MVNPPEGSDAIGGGQRPERLPTRLLATADFTATSYVECRLAACSAQIDHLVAIPHAASQLARTTVWAVLPSVGETFALHWRPVLSLLDRWGDGKSGVSKSVPTLWLEFDDIGWCGEKALRPSVSLCLVPAYRADRPPVRVDAPSQRAVIDEALEVMGVAPNPAELEGLRHCFELLPPGAHFIHFSCMLGRPQRALKLYGELTRAQLVPYLRAIRQAGDLTSIASLLEELYPEQILGEHVFVDLNVTSLRDPDSCSLGLAVGQQQLRHPEADPARRALLRRWQRAGLCASSRLTRIASWLGDPRSALASRGRFLDLKLVWQPQRLSAKAYLGTFTQEGAEAALAALEC